MPAPAEPFAAVAELGRRACAASRHLARVSTAEKDAALIMAADLLVERTPEILEANQADVEAARAAGMERGPLDRLRLDEARIEAMADGLRSVAALPDPIGEILDGWTPPDGLEIQRGARAARCGGDHLREPAQRDERRRRDLREVRQRGAAPGSGSALHSNVAIADVLRMGSPRSGCPADSVLLVDDVSHEAAVALMQLTDSVDCLIPRGGPALIQTIRDHATVPVIIDGDGNCHVYVDESADLDEAIDDRRQLEDAAAERVQLVGVAPRARGRRRSVPPARVRRARRQRRRARRRRREPRRSCRRWALATDDDFAQRVPVVEDVGRRRRLDSTMRSTHVNRFGTGHTEAILTCDLDAARRFTHEVDAAVVVVNASTRFTDGERFGFGAEIGISTQKLHAAARWACAS